MKDVGFEYKRQLIHLAGGVLIALGVSKLMPVYGKLTVLPILAGVVVFKLLPKIRDILGIHNHLMEKYERDKDLKTTPYKGAINYGLGIAAPILFLKVELACAVIMILSVGDSLSTIVGKTIGRTPVGFRDLKKCLSFLDKENLSHPWINSFVCRITRTQTTNKTLEGFVGFMVGGFIGSVFCIGVLQGFFLSIIGGFLELLVPLDDNISIPWLLTPICLVFLP